MLTLDHVTFGYSTTPTYDFTMEALAGEVTAIRGSSGSGKSTLLDLIAGFLAPASGTIRIDGHTVNALPPEQRPVSILFQSETLFEHLSAEDAGIALRQLQYRACPKRDEGDWRTWNLSRQGASEALNATGIQPAECYEPKVFD